MRIASIIVCLIGMLSGCNPGAGIQSIPLTPENLKTKHHYTLIKRDKRLSKRFEDPQLHRLICLALRDSPDILTAKARLQQANQVAKATYASLFPSASLNGAANQQYFTFSGVIPPSLQGLNINKATIANVGVNFNYELDLWGKNKAAFLSKLSQQHAVEMELLQSELILTSAVTTTYFQIQDSIKQQQLSRMNVKVLAEIQDIILARTKQGIDSDMPLKSAIANTQSARLAIEDYKRLEQVSRHQLAVLIGKNPFTTQIDIQPYYFQNQHLNLSKDLTINVLAQRPDIAATKARAEAAAQQIKVAKAAFYPDINLSGLLNLQSLYFSRDFHVSFGTDSTKVAVNLPLFDVGVRKANLGIKYAEYDLAINQYNQTVLNGLQEVHNLLSTLKSLTQQIQDQTRVLDSTKSNYQLFTSRYKAGIIDYTQLIQIKQLTIEQQATLYTLQTQKKQAFVALITALGGEVSSK